MFLVVRFSLMTSIGTMCCGHRFCVNGKVGLGAAGGFRSAVHMVAIVAGYRKAFIGRPFLFTFAQMGLESTPLTL